VDPVKEKVYVSLGSNLGDRAKNMQQALMALRQEGIAVTKISSVYETEPVDYLDQPWFLNMAVEGETELAPAALLETLRGIETQMGSKKLVAKGPRLIDIDILLYSSEIIDTPELQIPHPRMHLRRFVLQPLAEIAPNVRHPILGMTAAEMLASTRDKSTVRTVSGL
jgi:2-amino-4-hydroxy-6-hydroxymethyldihydropteridine diphosphokinase